MLTRRTLLERLCAASPIAMVERILRPPSATLPPGSTGIVASPFQFVLTGAENLRVRSANSLAGVTIALHGRRLLSDGTIQPFTYTHTPHTDRTVKTEDYPLGGGTILTLTAFASAGTPQRGQTFVQVQVIQGLSGATVPLATLLQGYVTSFQQLAWPGSPIESASSGRGFINLVHGTTPAVGTAISETVPAGVRWRLMQFSCTCVTVPAAHLVGAFFRPIIGGTVTGRFGTNTKLSAGMTNFMTFAANPVAGGFVNQAGTQEIVVYPLYPELYFVGGDIMQVSGFDLDPGDQFSDVTYVVEEWLELL